MLVDCESSFSLTIDEVLSTYQLSSDQLNEMIVEGIIAIDKIQDNIPILNNESCYKVRIASQLYHDLGVNIAGAALILELLHEIDTLRHR